MLRKRNFPTQHFLVCRKTKAEKSLKQNKNKESLLQFSKLQLQINNRKWTRNKTNKKWIWMKLVPIIGLITFCANISSEKNSKGEKIAFIYIHILRNNISRLWMFKKQVSARSYVSTTAMSKPPTQKVFYYSKPIESRPKKCERAAEPKTTNGLRNRKFLSHCNHKRTTKLQFHAWWKNAHK